MVEPEKVYYKANKWTSCIDRVRSDASRGIFLEKLRNDEQFRQQIGWTEKPVEQYVKDYQLIGSLGGASRVPLLPPSSRLQ